MSGHSKWANIRIKKTAQDAKRGKVFTKHAKLIEISARAGGGDPATNSHLRTAIDNARAENVPHANIERAIMKGTGDGGGEQMEEILYAAYLPGNIACLIECLTDNRNRTIANLRSTLEKNGGKWAEVRSVLFLFEQKGVVIARQPHPFVDAEFDEHQLFLIDLGADDIATNDGVITVTTNLSAWIKIRDYLKSKGCDILEAGLKYVPRQMIDVSDDAVLKEATDVIEALEEDDDVAEVFTNMK